MRINEMAQAAHTTSLSKGWYDGGHRNVPELLMLVVSELSEALEELRKGNDPQYVYYKETNHGDKPEGFPIEIADAVIRIGDLCAYLGIDLEDAIKIKMEFNKKRPYKHGKVL